MRVYKDHTKMDAKARPDTETAVPSRPVSEESEQGVMGYCGKTPGSQVAAYMDELESAISPALVRATSNVSANKFVNDPASGTEDRSWYRDVLIVVAEFADDESGVVHIMHCCHPKPVPAQNHKPGILSARDSSGCRRRLLGSMKKGSPHHWLANECHCCTPAPSTGGKLYSCSTGKTSRNNQQWENKIVIRRSSACWNTGMIDDQSWSGF